MSSSRSTEPAVRATFLRMSLARLGERWPEEAAAARAALGHEALASIDRASGLDWLPLSLDVTLARAVHARRGDEGVRQLGREVGHGAADHPLLKPLVTATLGMMGRHPEALAAAGIKGWGLATRRAGRLVVGACTGREVCFEISALPEVMRERALLFRMGGAAESLFDLAGIPTALAVEWEPGASRATLRLSWPG
jgi:hypothetical protein